MSKKRGKLSNGEMQFIRDNCNSLSITKIAEHLNRTEAPVRRYIEENALNSPQISDDESFRIRIKTHLHAKAFWKNIVVEFDPQEIAYFEEVWIDIMKQFNEDVTSTEEAQIKHWITTGILMSRCMLKQRLANEDAVRLNDFIKDELKKAKEDRDENKLMVWQDQLNMSRTAMQSFTGEYTKLAADYKSLTKDMKATREQRVQRIKDAKTSFQAWLRMLQDEEVRRRQGREAGIMKLAKEKAWEDIAQLHTYCDDRIDRPLNNAEVLDKFDSKEKEET